MSEERPADSGWLAQRNCRSHLQAAQSHSHSQICCLPPLAHPSLPTPPYLTQTNTVFTNHNIGFGYSTDSSLSYERDNQKELHRPAGLFCHFLRGKCRLPILYVHWLKISIRQNTTSTVVTVHLSIWRNKLHQLPSSYSCGQFYEWT